MNLIGDGLLSPAHHDNVLIERLSPDGTGSRHWTYGEIAAWCSEIQRSLADRFMAPGARVGLVAANSPEWIAGDLALLLGGQTEVPVPLVFSAEQAASLLQGVDVCLADNAGVKKLAEWGLHTPEDVILLQQPAPSLDSGTAVARPTVCATERIVKIIHTSGTTGTPKGVKIRADGLMSVLQSINAVSPPPPGVYERYLSLVPFSLLIEQVTAIYLPVMNGGRVVLLPDSAALLGTAGSRGLDALTWIRRGRPTATVLTPAAVSALDKAVQDHGTAEVFGDVPLPFLMAGGAPVDSAALLRLDAAGLRIYEGYGLSENSSVVSWNTPGSWRPGTAGKPLPHCRVKLSEDDELLVRSSSMFAGYTVEDPTSRPVDEDGWLHTGDRAEIDGDGYIRILGRLKNVIITSHGRNVSPEWVEGSLRSCPDVADAVIFGDGMEQLIAVLVITPDADPEQIKEHARKHAQVTLAETDRPQRYITVPDSKEFRRTYFTVTGRPRRDLIFDSLSSSTL